MQDFEHQQYILTDVLHVLRACSENRLNELAISSGLPMQDCFLLQ